MSNNDHNKLRWLGPAMNGDNAAVIRSLAESLPNTESLDAEQLKSMDVARNFMAELFLRGIAKDSFLIESGLTGFPVEALPAGFERHEMGGPSALYYKFWLAQKDAAESAQGIKEILLSRQTRLDAQYHPWYRLQLCIDVDCSRDKNAMPLQIGLTTNAICLEFGLDDVESAFARIDAACEKLSKLARNKVRLILGQFAQQEFAGFSRINLFSKGIPYRVAAEWILFKNIHGRARKSRSHKAKSKQ